MSGLLFGLSPATLKRAGEDDDKGGSELKDCCESRGSFEVSVFVCVTRGTVKAFAMSCGNATGLLAEFSPLEAN